LIKVTLQSAEPDAAYFSVAVSAAEEEVVSGLADMCLLTDFCPLGCYRPIKNFNLYAKFYHESLIFSKKVTLN